MALSVFLFSDIEGSTRLWALHRDRMAEALERHDQVLRAAVENAGGDLFKHTGDGMVARFGSAEAAMVAAVAGQRGLAAIAWGELGDLRVRIGIHAGEATERGGDWFGPVLNRTARLMGLAHGGQILLSGAVAALVRETLPAGVALVDLGAAQLRDLDLPEHVYGIEAEGLLGPFPPLRTAQATPTNLPRSLSSFLGRGTDVAAVASAVADHRLVTLTGPGGVGKTRLSLEAAAEVALRFRDGVWLCELASLADVEAVEHALLSVLGFVVRPGATPRATLLDALATRELLVVLDNCEHVSSVAAGLAADVLSSSEGVRVLATSREPLGIPGEQVWTVEPLPVETDAVSLFAERAGAVRRGFSVTPENRATVVELCRQLDGVPLAIELAAARVRSLSPADLLGRLGERFRLLGGGRGAGGSSRQATLAAALDWSYDLLTAEEQALFDRLSIFVGGFDAAAASAVAGPEGADELDVLDVLTGLVDKSMVRLVSDAGEGMRYGLLETMRHYGALRLSQGGPDLGDGLARTHAEYFAALIEEIATGVRGPDEARWVEVLDAEFDNVRAATRWAVAHHDVDLGMRLVARLWTCPIDRMTLEPAEWAEDVLALVGAEDHPLAALAHVTAGYGAQQMGRYADAFRHGEAAVAHADAHHRPEDAWLALMVAIGGAGFLGDHEYLSRKTGLVERWARESGDPYMLSRALWSPIVTHRLSNPDLVVADAAAECLALAEQLANPTSLSRAHYAAAVVCGHDDPAGAARHLAECERYATTVGGRYMVGIAIAGTAMATMDVDPIAGLKELLRALDWQHATGSPMGIIRGLMRDLLPGLESLRLHDVVVALDAKLPPISLFGPEQTAAAVERAQQELGALEAERLRDRARSMADAELLAFLRSRVTQVLTG